MQLTAADMNRYHSQLRAIATNSREENLRIIDALYGRAELDDDASESAVEAEARQQTWIDWGCPDDAGLQHI